MASYLDLVGLEGEERGASASRGWLRRSTEVEIGWYVAVKA